MVYFLIIYWRKEWLQTTSCYVAMRRVMTVWIYSLLFVLFCEYIHCQSWEDDHEYECGLHQGIGAEMVNQGLEL